MKKILLAIDGLQINMNALDFACYIGRLTKSRITGVFLENLAAEQRPVLKNTIPIVAWEIDRASEEHKEKIRKIEQNIVFFKEACGNREVNCLVHRDRGEPAKEMIEESRFADLLIIDAETSFNKRYEGSPTEFVKDTLIHAECPVIISPGSFESIDEIIFTYDGSRSSVFAIKQFGYLFPELKNKKTTLLEITTNEETTIEQKHKIREWFKEHYIDCGCEVLHGNVKDQLFRYLLPQKNTFVIMGSYGRNLISSFFKKSRADIVLKTTNLAIFIAHC